MKTYQIKLSLPSGFLTPWQSDTIYGHLCWAAERSNAFSNFRGAREFIDLFRKRPPPLVLSDGFPGHFLPAPADLRDRFRPGEDAGLDCKGYAYFKQIKKAQWLTPEQFSGYQKGVGFSYVAPKNKPVILKPTLHNQIDRITNTTGENGGLFELNECFVRDGLISIYAHITDTLVEDIKQLFNCLARTGFGAKKSTGKGTFKVIGFEPFTGFCVKETATGFISLSHLIPSEKDPAEGSYRTMVKYGKLGEEKTFCGNPFKRPLVMLRPGAVFRCPTPPKWCGRLVENIAYGDSDVVQFGFSFNVPIIV